MNIHDFDNNGAMFPLLNWMPREALLSLFEPSDEHTHYVTGIQKFGPEAGERAKVSYDTIKAFKDGWKVSLTEISGDYGGDLIAERDELHWCIQCKDTGKPAGVVVMQQAVVGASYYGCDYAVVVSRNGFTNQAVQLASKLKVTLCNENSINKIHLMV